VAALRRKTITIILILFITAAFLIAGGMAFLLQRSIGPCPGDQGKRQQVRAFLQRVYGAEMVRFPSSDGTPLAGFLITRPKSRGTVVLCHGYRHSKEWMARYIRLFPEYTILAFDFRASGQSGGSFSSIGYYESNDVRGAIAYLQKRFGPQSCRPLIVLGVSMGAAAALKAASELRVGVDGLILDSPYAQLSDIIRESMHQFSCVPAWLSPWVQKVAALLLGPVLSMHPERDAARLSIPTFLIHSRSDSITNPSHSVRLFARLYKNKGSAAWLWLTPPARHAASFLSCPREYEKRVRTFLEKILRSFRVARLRSLAGFAAKKQLSD